MVFTNTSSCSPYPPPSHRKHMREQKKMPPFWQPLILQLLTWLLLRPQVQNLVSHTTQSTIPVTLALKSNLSDSVTVDPLPENIIPGSSSPASHVSLASSVPLPPPGQVWSLSPPLLLLSLQSLPLLQPQDLYVGDPPSRGPVPPRRFYWTLSSQTQHVLNQIYPLSKLHPPPGFSVSTENKKSPPATQTATSEILVTFLSPLLPKLSHV